MTSADPVRAKELAAIHVAAKSLALEEDSYRALVTRFSKGRVSSAKAMTSAERRALIEHFRTLGFKPKPKSPGDRRRDTRPQAAKARALWLSLWQLGALRDPSEHALGGFLLRHTGLEALQFADAAELNRVIEHLKAWCARLGYVGAADTDDWETALIRAQWERLIALGAFRHGAMARLDTWLHGQGYHVAAPQFLSFEQKTAVIGALGKWLRRIATPEETP